MWEAIWPGLWRAKFVASAYFFSKGTAKEDAVSLPPTVEFDTPAYPSGCCGWVSLPYVTGSRTARNIQQNDRDPSLPAGLKGTRTYAGVLNLP